MPYSGSHQFLTRKRRDSARFGAADTGLPDNGIRAMQIWPAIDLRGGKCVRLKQGDYSRETVYGDDPAEMARRWVDAGATCLHLVDLDGARDGAMVNLKSIEAIVAAAGVPCELGGGIRDGSGKDIVHQRFALRRLHSLLQKAIAVFFHHA